jgi:hypothetical protein
MTMSFPFSAPVPGAVFRRGDTLWCVFETAEEQSVSALSTAANPALAAYVSGASETLEGGVRVIRIKASAHL